MTDNAMIDQRLLERIDALILKGEEVIRSELPPVSGVITFQTWVQTGLFYEWRNQAVSFLTSILGPTHPYTVNFAAACKDDHLTDAQAGTGILRAVREDIQGGYLATLREMVHAEIFDDFLEMAEYLMAEGRGYKDAASVLAGGVLEEHLRKLCQRHSIPTETQTASGAKPKKADTMNAELAKENVYNKIQQKIVTGWLGIRNDAAHANYDEYTKEQVTSLIDGVRDFIPRFPA